MLTQRLRCCCLDPKAASIVDAKVPWGHAPCPDVLSFDEATGVAAVELDAFDLVTTLEAALRLLVRLRSAVRAVAFHIAESSPPCARFPARTLEQIDQTLDTLHGLGLPTVCSADGNVCGTGLAAWPAAHCRVAGEHQALQAVRYGSTSERTTCARDRALQFAAWLAHHPGCALPASHFDCTLSFARAPLTALCSPSMPAGLGSSTCSA